MDGVLQDIRFAIRSLSRAPAFAAAALLTLALGTGASTAVLSLLDDVLLRPLALPHPSQLHLLEVRNGPDGNNSFSWPEFGDLRAAPAASGRLAAFSALNAVTSGGREAAHAWGEQVSGDYFAVLGARPALGRLLGPADDRTGAPPVVVLSHGAWQRQFGGDRGVLGRSLTLNRSAFTIVGVAAPEFHGMIRSFRPEFWVAVSQAIPVTGDDGALTTRRSRWLQLVARVPGEPAPFAAAMDVAEHALQRAHADAPAREGRIVLRPAGRGDSDLLNEASRIAMVLAVLVGALLVLAAANLAGLLLARAALRRREMGVRLALGGSRGRLVRQLLTESLLLAGIGGALGLLVAEPMQRILVAFQPASPLPVMIDPRLDLRVLLAAFGIVTVTGLAFGLAPALASARVDLLPALRDDGSTGWWPGRRLTLRGALVVLQISLSLVLLLGAGLFARSLSRELARDPGFDPRGRWALSLDLGGIERTPERAQAFAGELVRRVRALPGVEDATLVQYLQPAPGGSRMGYEAGELGLPNVGAVEFDVNAVGPDYFRTLGITMRAGRDFTDAEGLAASEPHVVVLNQSLARRLYGEANPIGQLLHFEGPSRPAYTVVGVVRDVPLRSLRDEPKPAAYLAAVLTQTPTPILIVRARPGTQPLAAAARIAREADVHAATYDPVSLERHLGDALAVSRLTAMLLAAFAVLALALAGLGVYGVLAQAVARRRREIGVRIALGARPQDVEWLVLGQGLRLVVAGVLVGIVAAALMARAVTSMLYGVTPFDPPTWIAAAAVLVVGAVTASWLPARRAARVDPSVALRAE